MPRPKSAVPGYSHHKPSGQACVYVKRQRLYLGAYGSPESKQRYAEVLESLATGQEAASQPAASTAVQPALTIAELFLQFTIRELPRFSPSESYCFRSAMRVCLQLFAHTLVQDFGPVKYRLMRDAMVAGETGDSRPADADGKPLNARRPWSRQTANRQAKRIRAIFRWGASWEMVKVEVVHALDTVRSLAIGETDAAESVPRLAVPQADLDAVRKLLRPMHRDIFDLLCLTGARPGEILSLTGRMIEKRSDGTWLAELTQHKTARKGKRRFLVFGATAQGILLWYMKTDLDARLFSMRRDNFSALIPRVCRRAGVPKFVPHQLRHTIAARLVDEVGLEAAQAVLGHSEAAMTLHYARSAERQAVAAVQKLG